jgi:hypothetical protein
MHNEAGWRNGGCITRTNGNAILKVSFPLEVQWKPPLHQAAGRYMQAADSAVGKSKRN